MIVIVSMMSIEVSFAVYEVSAGVYDGVTCPIDLVFICIVQQVVKSSDYVLIGFNNSFCDADWLVEVRSCQKVLNSDNIINVGVDEDIFEPSDGVRIRSRQ